MLDLTRQILLVAFLKVQGTSQEALQRRPIH